DCGAGFAAPQPCCRACPERCGSGASSGRCGARRGRGSGARSCARERWPRRISPLRPRRRTPRCSCTATSASSLRSLISIVIVNWNSGRLLERCVESLLRGPRVYEIIVVDNASADPSLDFLGRMSYPLTLLRNAENTGFAAGNNRGWRFSRGEHVLFLNPDTESTPGAVEKLESLLVEDRSIWAAGGKLVRPDRVPP